MVRNYKRVTEDRWSKEDLLEALMKIKDCKMKITDAVKQYCISRATLYRHLKKFLLAGGKYDVNQFRGSTGGRILTYVEENVLEETIQGMRKQGLSVTSKHIKQICFEYCDANGIPNLFNQETRRASDDWYHGFLNRHPGIKTATGADGDLVKTKKKKETGRIPKKSPISQKKKTPHSKLPLKNPDSNNKGPSTLTKHKTTPTGSKQGYPKKSRLQVSKNGIIETEREPTDNMMDKSDEDEDRVEEQGVLDILAVAAAPNGHDEERAHAADNYEMKHEKIDSDLDFNFDTQQEKDDEEEDESIVLGI